MKHWYYLLLVIPLLFVACSDDDDDDNNNYEGPNYQVAVSYEMAGDMKDSDSLLVEVIRRNPDADSPDEAEIIVDGHTLLLAEYDEMDSTAYFSSSEVAFAADEEYEMSFVCGDDSATTLFSTPPPVVVTITSPVMMPGDTTLPTFIEGSPIGVTWEYEGDEPPYVSFFFTGVNVPLLREYAVSVPGNVTTHTIPGDTTMGLGGHGWPMPTIVVCPQDVATYDTDELEIDISVTGMPDMAFVNILESDTSSTEPDPVVTVGGEALMPVFSWDQPRGAMGLAVYRNSENHGQDHTGMIWNCQSNDPTVGFSCPVTFGVFPEETWGSEPTEDIIAGEEYTVMITFWISEGYGIQVFESWST